MKSLYPLIVVGYTGADGGPCTGCALNTYKSVSGSATCTSCPLNSKTVQPNATSVAACVCIPGSALYFRLFWAAIIVCSLGYNGTNAQTCTGECDLYVTICEAYCHVAGC